MEINEKKLKGILKEQREEYQRHLDIVAENFISQVKLLAESVSGIQVQLIALRDLVAKNTKDIEILKVRVMTIEKDMSIMKEDMFTMKKDMCIMKEDMFTMKKDMCIMKEDISTIKFDLKRRPSLDEFEALEKRVLILEKKK